MKISCTDPKTTQSELDRKEARLREIAGQIKQEMKGVTEEQWVQSIKKSREERRRNIPAFIRNRKSN